MNVCTLFRNPSSKSSTSFLWIIIIMCSLLSIFDTAAAMGRRSTVLAWTTVLPCTTKRTTSMSTTTTTGAARRKCAACFSLINSSRSHHHHAAALLVGGLQQSSNNAHYHPSHSSAFQKQRQKRLHRPQQPPRSRGLSTILMTAVDEDETTDMIKTVDSTWNMGGLKKEVQRLTTRCHKKLGKANQRLQNAKAGVDELQTNPDATLEELEACPDVQAAELECTELRGRYHQLLQLEQDLQDMKKRGNAVVLPPATATLALDLGVNDAPPPRPQRGPTKVKCPRSKTSQRLPYRRYYTPGGVEIRVGKKAEDNDQLTLSTEHRNDADWWMHAAGCPGSHVVIRCTIETVPDDVLQDAAALAARQSKATGAVRKVTLSRCRDIRKPVGAKAGLVQLTGNVRTITVRMNEAEKRLQRLDNTVLVN